ncbi:MAG: phage head morphogenesis protein, SPP1 gp7 family domain protein [Candidatus Magnetoglobus multicellularis str. Araruama]|uniref:Phage head morphogenesis protein, SPP1 gp7 family domain protein n=1 Tax=Candidatus Magnetoglobus multicellularis str. Araruama TaxID=890399 RepID=A0A1V1PDD6_9BACT|nr:MAG: phage head morphogenesis protein, SPP1 gp7 family domain protein [Candidatus Magnetoglobus multicellularis str. Araruama]
MKNIGTQIRTLKKHVNNYANDLKVLTGHVIDGTNELIIPVLKNGEGEISSALDSAFAQLKSGLNFDMFAKHVASEHVNTLVESHAERFYRSLKSFTKIDLRGVVNEEGLEDFVAANVSNNVSLISDIPTEYFKKIEQITYNGITSGKRYDQIASEIASRYPSLESRAYRIAADQSQTITSQINVKRSTNVGIKQGYYRTSKDENVRPWHKELDGMLYFLEKGAYSQIKKNIFSLA